MASYLSDRNLNSKDGRKLGPDQFIAENPTPDQAAQIFASREKLAKLDISDRKSDRRDERSNTTDRKDDRGGDRNDRYWERGETKNRERDRYSKPAPLPPAVQSTRREDDDRYSPRSPAARDSREDRYERRGPISPRTSYGPGAASYRDEKGSRQTSYNSKDGKHYESSTSQTTSDKATPSTRPAQNSAPSTSHGAEDSEHDELWRYFKQVDQDRTGQLSEAELGRALVNGDYTTFDPHTVRMMIRMFDVDRSGTIDFNEFVELWDFLHKWRKLFNRFDVDKSGTIDFDEFREALIAFGYRLSDEYVGVLFRTYDTRRRGVLSFDLFVQSCISLKRMTDVFKKFDDDRDGYITLSFEQFLTEALSQR